MRVPRNIINEIVYKCRNILQYQFMATILMCLFLIKYMESKYKDSREMGVS